MSRSGDSYLKPGTYPELEAKLRETGDALKVARLAYRVAFDDLVNARIADFKFKVGDVIASSKGVRAKIFWIGERNGCLEFKAYLAKKNGEFGLREATLWSTPWDDIVLVEPAP